MILVDTSVWVDLLRDGHRPSTLELERCFAESQELACCEVIAMELLAGARGRELARVERLVNGLSALAVEPAEDYRRAAAIYRAVRASGHTVRAINDCLIAAIAIRADALLLDADRDFDRIAAVTPLRRWSPA